MLPITLAVLYFLLKMKIERISAKLIAWRAKEELYLDRIKSRSGSFAHDLKGQLVAWFPDNKDVVSSVALEIFAFSVTNCISPEIIWIPRDLDTELGGLSEYNHSNFDDDPLNYLTLVY